MEALSDSIGLPQWIVILVALQRIGELVLARRNTAKLLEKGGVEVGSGHYPLFVLLHGTWLLALFASVPPGAEIIWPLIGLFCLLQLGRIWVIVTLGPYWTTRVISVPNAPLVTGGPFRFVRHPNYLIVTAEIAVLPLALSAWEIALAYSLLNAALLRHRIAVEDTALHERRTSGSTA